MNCLSIPPSIRGEFRTSVSDNDRFCQRPALQYIHHRLLKGIALYLRATIDWGIHYKRSVLDHGLPSSTAEDVLPSRELPSFPEPDYPLQLRCFVDAAHANDLRNRRSTTGYAFLLCGGAIFYRSTTQTLQRPVLLRRNSLRLLWLPSMPATYELL